jgi:hypothetical protein
VTSFAKVIRNSVKNRAYEYSEIIWTRSEGVVAKKSAGDRYCVCDIESRDSCRKNSTDGLISREGKQAQ